MSAVQESLAEILNRDCDCTCTDLQVLQQRLDADLERNQTTIVETHPHLFSGTPVFLDPAQARGMEHIVETVETLVRMPAYQRAVIGRAPQIARAPQRVAGVFTGFDFHLSPQGPKLIEINTNAGGAFLNIAARQAQQACCRVADDGEALAPTPAPRLEAELYAMFLKEWRLARGDQPLRSIAIVDESPAEQYLYPEFQLARKLFRARGITTFIADPVDLAVAGGRLCVKGEPVDLVYNRLTDFYFDDARNQALRTAYVDDLAIVTPHPRAHALYADKHNLALLSDPQALRDLGAQDSLVDALTRGVPVTRAVTEGELDWWRERKDWFFKPRHGFGSRGAYRGDKMTRRVFGDVMSGQYIAQQLTPPSERWRTTDGGREAFKVDVRCYAYGGHVQLMAARLYRGQTTNFRTAGGGFAPVYVVGSRD